MLTVVWRLIGTVQPILSQRAFSSETCLSIHSFRNPYFLFSPEPYQASPSSAPTVSYVSTFHHPEFYHLNLTRGDLWGPDDEESLGFSKLCVHLLNPNHPSRAPSSTLSNKSRNVVMKGATSVGIYLNVWKYFSVCSSSGKYNSSSIDTSQHWTVWVSSLFPKHPTLPSIPQLDGMLLLAHFH